MPRCRARTAPRRSRAVPQFGLRRPRQTPRAGSPGPGGLITSSTCRSAAQTFTHLHSARKTPRWKNFASRDSQPVCPSARRQSELSRIFVKKFFSFHEVIHIHEERKPRFQSNQSGKDDKLGPSMIDRGTGSTDGTEGKQHCGRGGEHAPFARACTEPPAFASSRPRKPSDRPASRSRHGGGQALRSLRDHDRLLARGIGFRGKARSDRRNRL